jgi:PAS domain-containing protein
VGPAPLDCWAVFDAAPDAYLILAADPPRFTIVAANEERLRVTSTERENIIGRPLFEVFPDNPGDPGATGVSNLSASLNEVIRTRRPHRMALQKYDIRTPEGGFEERYWDPLNSPVLDASGAVINIIHRVEDVTDQVRSGARIRQLESDMTRESAARAEEARARRAIETILERITDAFYALDRDWRYTYVNSRA